MKANVDEQQSVLNDIKREIQRGGNVTHILNVIILNEPNSEIGNRIRQRINSTIAENTIAKDINGVRIAIKRKARAKKTSAYFYFINIF